MATRNTGMDGAGTLGINQNLAAPGLAVPAVREREDIGRAIQSLIGSTINATGAVADYSRQQQYLNQKDLAEKIENASHAAFETWANKSPVPEFNDPKVRDAFYESLAAWQMSDFNYEDFYESIPEGMSPADAVSSHILDSTKGLPPIYAETKAKIMLPRVVAIHNRRVEELKETTAKDFVEQYRATLSNTVGTASDGQRELEKKVGDAAWLLAEKAGKTREQFLEDTIVYAAKNAANRGDRERVKELSAMLDKEGRSDLVTGVMDVANRRWGVSEIDKAKSEFMLSSKPISEAATEAISKVGKMLEDGVDPDTVRSTISGIQSEAYNAMLGRFTEAIYTKQIDPETLRKETDKAYRSGAINGGHYMALMNSLNSDTSKALRQQIRNDYDAHVLSNIRNGLIVRDLSIVGPDGNLIEEKAGPATQRALDSLMQEAQEEASRQEIELFPGEKPEEAATRAVVSRMAPILLKNGLKYDYFEDILEHGVRTLNMTAITGKDGPGKGWTDGLMLYRQLGAAARLQCSDETEAIYEQALREAEKNNDPASIGNAIIRRRESVSLMDFPKAELQDIANSEDFADIWPGLGWKWGEPKNLQYMREVYYAKMADEVRGGNTVETARKNAIEHIKSKYTTLDGVMYKRFERHLDLEPFREDAIYILKKRYYDTHKDEGLIFSDLRMMQVSDNRFQLYDMSGGITRPVEDVRDDVGTFTFGQILDYCKVAADERRDIGRADLMQKPSPSGYLSNREMDTYNAWLVDSRNEWERGNHWNAIKRNIFAPLPPDRRGPPPPELVSDKAMAWPYPEFKGTAKGLE